MGTKRLSGVQPAPAAGPDSNRSRGCDWWPQSLAPPLLSHLPGSLGKRDGVEKAPHHVNSSARSVAWLAVNSINFLSHPKPCQDPVWYSGAAISPSDSRSCQVWVARASGHPTTPFLGRPPARALLHSFHPWPVLSECLLFSDPSPRLATRPGPGSRNGRLPGPYRLSRWATWPSSAGEPCPSGLPAGRAGEAPLPGPLGTRARLGRGRG